jgi:hypothetical protein
VTISKRNHALYLRGQLRQKKYKMITNYGKILYNLCRSPQRFGSPEFDLEKASKIIKKLAQINIAVDEKQKIKSKIQLLKQEGKI